jgi:hypothetical protein
VRISTRRGIAQRGEALLLANLAAILGGILVFGEPIGSGALGITARLLAFCFVIAGEALVPAPLRARSGRASSPVPFWRATTPPSSVTAHPTWKRAA